MQRETEGKETQTLQFSENTTEGPCTPSLTVVGFSSYSSSFPIKMLVTDAKTQKIEADPIVFL